MAESISFTREVAGFIKNHKALCVMTLGLAIVAYSVTKLGGRGIAWLKERFNTSKKVEETTKEIFENKSQAPQEPKVSLPPIQQVQKPEPKPEKITVVSQPILLPKTPEEQLNEELSAWEKDPMISGNKQQAESCIRQAFTKHNSTLDLENMRLTRLPECIGYLTHLKTLNLKGNKLTELPKSLTSLNQLYDLNLDNNQFTHLPEQISSFTHLTKLSLWNNKLEDLGEGIGNCVKLKFLNLTANKIKDLPDQIGACNDLEILALGGNKLKRLPEDGRNLIKLKVVALDSNLFDELPKEMESWICLEEVSLRDNPFKKLPEWVICWEKLKQIDLRKSSLEELPEEVKSWSNLEEIQVENTPLKKLPDGVGEWKKLKRLDLKDNKIEELPDAIGKCTSLESIYMFNIPIQKLPKTVGQLKNLKTLNITRAPFLSLPSEIGNCSALETLRVQQSSLKELPSSLGDLQNLKNLEVSEGGLTTIPNEIGRCASLKTIDLSSNQIAVLPEGPYQWSQVTELNLSHNQLTTLPESLRRAFVSSESEKLSIHNLKLSYNQFSALPSFIGTFNDLWNLYVDHNKDLNELPASFGSLSSLGEWRYDDAGLHAEGTGIPENVIEALEKQWKRSDKELSMNRRLDTWKAISKGEFDLDPIKNLANSADKLNIDTWLKKLELTPNFSAKIGGVQSELAKIVLELLLNAARDEKYGQLFFAQLEDIIGNCQDRSAMVLNEFYTAWEISKLDPKAPIKEKLHLAECAAKTSALRNAIGKKIVEWQKKENIAEVEESVEIYLYYETLLKDELKLISLMNGMRYEDIGRRDWIKVSDLKKEVEKTYIDELTTLDLFESICKEDEGVQEALESLNEQFYEKLESINEEQKKLKDLRTVAFERKEAVDDLTKEITALEENSKQIPLVLKLENRRVFKEWYLKRVKQ